MQNLSQQRTQRNSKGEQQFASPSNYQPSSYQVSPATNQKYQYELQQDQGIDELQQSRGAIDQFQQQFLDNVSMLSNAFIDWTKDQIAKYQQAEAERIQEEAEAKKKTDEAEAIARQRQLNWERDQRSLWNIQTYRQQQFILLVYILIFVQLFWTSFQILLAYHCNFYMTFLQADYFQWVNYLCILLLAIVEIFVLYYRTEAYTSPYKYICFFLFTGAYGVILTSLGLIFLVADHLIYVVCTFSLGLPTSIMIYSVYAANKEIDFTIIGTYLCNQGGLPWILAMVIIVVLIFLPTSISCVVLICFSVITFLIGILLIHSTILMLRSQKHPLDIRQDYVIGALLIYFHVLKAIGLENTQFQSSPAPENYS